MELSDLSLLPIQVAVIDPGSLRLLNDLLESETKGRGKVEVLNFTSIGDEAEDEMLE